MRLPGGLGDVNGAVHEGIEFGRRLHAYRIQARAIRRCGELLAEMAEKGERREQGNGVKSRDATSLDALCISKHESSRFQQAAAAPAAARNIYRNVGCVAKSTARPFTMRPCSYYLSEEVS